MGLLFIASVSITLNVYFVADRMYRKHKRKQLVHTIIKFINEVNEIFAQEIKNKEQENGK